MTNLTNIHSGVVLLTDNHRIVLSIAYSLIAALGIPANFFILSIIIWNKKLRRLPLNQYVVTLAFTDILTCGLSAPFSIFSVNVTPNLDVLRSGILCKGIITVTYSIGLLTMSALAALSIDRCLAIKKPYFYCRYITSKEVFIINISLFMQVFVTTLPLALVDGYIVNNNIQGLVCGTETQNWNLIYSTYIIVVNVVLPLLAITLCNIVVFRIAKYQFRKVSDSLPHNLKNKQSSTPSALSYSTRKSSVCRRFSTCLQGNQAMGNVLLVAEKCSINCDDEEGKKNVNMLKLEVTHSVKKEDDTVLNETQKKVRTQVTRRSAKENSLRTSFKSRESKHKEKDLPRFKFQYRIYISTLSMIFLLFIFWSPFPILRLIVILGYKDVVTNHAFLYSALAITLLSAINPFVIFVTRKEFQKYTWLSKRKTTRLTHNNRAMSVTTKF